MKKLIIILGLLLATVTAFGKPAYKQWKKDKVDYSINRDKEVEGSYLRLGYMNVRHKTKKDGDFAVAWYLNTNQFVSGQVRIMVSVSASDEIDFSVGSNTVRYISIGSGITNNVLLTKVSVSDGRYNYFADIGWVEASSLKGGTLFLISCFKDEGSWRLFDCIDIYSKWQDAEAVRVLKAQADERLQVEERAKSEAMMRTKRVLNDKRYTVEYRAGVDANVVQVSYNNFTSSGTSLVMDLLLNRTNYTPKWIQFKVLTDNLNSFGYMNNVYIHTADGDMRLRGVMQNWFQPTINEYRTVGYKTYVYSWCNSSDFAHLNDMLMSGKPIKISFSGSANVTHTLTASERKALSDLLDVVFTSWQEDRKTFKAKWSE